MYRTIREQKSREQTTHQYLKDDARYYIMTSGPAHSVQSWCGQLLSISMGVAHAKRVRVEVFFRSTCPAPDPGICFMGVGGGRFYQRGGNVCEAVCMCVCMCMCVCVCAYVCMCVCVYVCVYVYVYVCMCMCMCTCMCMCVCVCVYVCVCTIMIVIVLMLLLK